VTAILGAFALFRSRDQLIIRTRSVCRIPHGRSSLRHVLPKGMPLVYVTCSQLINQYSIAAWCIVFMLGTALQTGAPSLNFIWAGRWFAGMGVGARKFVLPFKRLTHQSVCLFLCTTLSWLPLVSEALWSLCSNSPSRLVFSSPTGSVMVPTVCSAFRTKPVY
jgi:hypothetical protein